MDNGTTHNFIARKLVTLQSENFPAQMFNVGLGNRSKCSSHFGVQAAQVKVGGYTLIVDAFVLDLGCVDLIPGILWLESLGSTIIDWHKKSMSFKVCRAL